MAAVFFEYFIPFIILFSIVVFIHELGHFLAARFFGVKVEVFSIGFGPKILKYKKGDTLYCLSLIPFGGYVKMFGDNPRKPPPEHKKKESFLWQKTGPKTTIAFAGPFMNIVLTLFLLTAVFMIGAEKAQPEIGDIPKDSQAFSAGFRSGDFILSINNQPISYFEEAAKMIDKSPEQKLTFKVKRGDETLFITAEPEKIKNKTLSKLGSVLGRIEGLTPLSRSAHVGISSNEARAYHLGLRALDEVTSVGDAKINNWRELEDFFQKKKSKLKPLKMEIKRDQDKTLTLNLPFLPLSKLGIEKPDLYIGKVKPSSPAMKAGLKEKDRLLALNSKKITSWEDFTKRVQQNGAQNLNLLILREGKEKMILITPEKTRFPQGEGQIAEKYMIGVASAHFLAPPKTIFHRTKNPIKALALSFKKTGELTVLIGRALSKLILGQISPRNLSGPIMIAKAAKHTFFESLNRFLELMALFSINLGLINLIPLPVLDGGHILLFTLEKLKGRPLDIRKVEIIYTLGFVFLIFLTIFAIFNDIQNWNLFW